MDKTTTHPGCPLGLSLMDFELPRNLALPLAEPIRVKELGWPGTLPNQVGVGVALRTLPRRVSENMNMEAALAYYSWITLGLCGESRSALRVRGGRFMLTLGLLLDCSWITLGLCERFSKASYQQPTGMRSKWLRTQSTT